MPPYPVSTIDAPSADLRRSWLTRARRRLVDRWVTAVGVVLGRPPYRDDDTEHPPGFGEYRLWHAIAWRPVRLSDGSRLWLLPYEVEERFDWDPEDSRAVHDAGASPQGAWRVVATRRWRRWVYMVTESHYDHYAVLGVFRCATRAQRYAEEVRALGRITDDHYTVRVEIERVDPPRTELRGAWRAVVDAQGVVRSLSCARTSTPDETPQDVDSVLRDDLPDGQDLDRLTPDGDYADYEYGDFLAAFGRTRSDAIATARAAMRRRGPLSETAQAERMQERREAGERRLALADERRTEEQADSPDADQASSLMGRRARRRRRSHEASRRRLRAYSTGPDAYEALVIALADAGVLDLSASTGSDAMRDCDGALTTITWQADPGSPSGARLLVHGGGSVLQSTLPSAILGSPVLYVPRDADLPDEPVDPDETMLDADPDGDTLDTAGAGALE